MSNRCCNKTNKRGLRSHRHCSVDFDHLPTSSPSPPHCGEVTLLLSMCGAVHADLLVLSQLLSEWGLTHPAFGPLFPTRASDWRAFCWQLSALLPRSKTSLLGCCRPSVQEGHHPGSAAMWHEQRRCVKGPCTGLPHGAWNHKYFNLYYILFFFFFFWLRGDTPVWLETTGWHLTCVIGCWPNMLQMFSFYRLIHSSTKFLN